MSGLKTLNFSKRILINFPGSANSCVPFTVVLSKKSLHDSPPDAKEKVELKNVSKSNGNGFKTNGSTKKWLHYDLNVKPTPESIRERSRTVASYYNQDAVDKAAAQPSVRLTPNTIMYSGRKNVEHNITKSAQYLHKELPIRIAQRINAIRSLPFIVGCNPTILAVHELYIRAFHLLNEFPEIITLEDEERFSSVLKELLDDHKDVVSLLAQGFLECKKHIKDPELIRQFLDKNLASRLGIRIIATHHLLLKERKDGHIGCINIRMNLKDVVQTCSEFVQKITEDRYGNSPAVRISGHVNATFPYIEMPLEYILPELLKNAMRATMEQHPNVHQNYLPPVYITIASNETDFIIKITDRGGGVPHYLMDKILQYNFSTAEKSTDQLMKDDVFGNFMETVNRRTTGPMHGYGFGLPTSRAYAEYLGGSLQIFPMQGLGTDVYLRLKHFNSKENPFRI